MSQTSQAPAQELPKRRITIAVMLFFTVVVNYLDRSNISIAAVQFKDEMQLTEWQLGWVFGVFGVAYTLAQIPGGIIADRFRPRVLYPTLLILWSVATFVQGLAGTALVLMICRVLVGVFEAPSYPINNRVVTAWFPEGERARAISFYTAGQYVGLGLLLPVLVWFQSEFGWRWLFYACGLVGIVWAAVWHAFYRDPDLDPSVNEDNRAALLQGGAVPIHDRTRGATPNWPSKQAIVTVLTSRKLWGIYLGQFCTGTLTIFFLTWFPLYLTEARGIAFEDIGWMAAAPFVCAMAGVLTAGSVSDWLSKKGMEKGKARKGPIVLGILLSTSLLGALFVESNVAAAVFFCIAFFGNGMASITWVFVSLLAPRRQLGLVGGVFNFVGGLNGLVTPLVFAALIDGTDYSLGFVYVTVVGLIGILAYTVLVGKVERVAGGDEDTPQSAQSQ